MDQKWKKWAPYAGFVLLALAVGSLSGWLTRDGVELYNQTAQKPPLSPPGWVFPVVWSVLYVLMGLGAARVYLAPPSEARRRGLGIFLLQLGFNFFWSILFFGLGRYGLALLWLLVMLGLIAAMIRLFSQVDRKAARLQIPYLLWVLFAAYLNAGVFFLNS